MWARDGNKRRGILFRKLVFVLPALALGLVALFGTASNQAQAASTITVKVGAGQPGYAVNLFAPGTVYIQPGDTVKWTFPWVEPHSVTFGKPTGDPLVLVGGANPSFDGTSFISSGLVFGGAPGTDYSVSFPKKGSYAYVCAIHVGMTGSVVVQTADLGQPDNQASVDARGAALIASSTAELKALAAASGAKEAAVTPKQGGGKKYTLAISSTRDSAAGDVMQFFPSAMNIGVNDSIEWVSNVHTPHTVSFGNPGDIAKLIPAGGAIAILDIAKAIPPGSNYDGTGIVNSGVLGIGWPGGTSFSLNFTKAGSYDYLCFLHADQAMVGKVNVGGQSAPGAPNTGSSVQALPDGSTGMWLIFGAIAMVAAASAGAFAVTRR